MKVETNKNNWREGELSVQLGKGEGAVGGFVEKIKIVCLFK